MSLIEDIKKIELTINALHGEALSVKQNNERREKIILADADKTESDYRCAQNDIEAVKRQYQAEIDENRSIIDNLHRMHDMLPAKIVDENQPVNVIKPNSIDIDYISELFENITTDTMSSAIKRRFRLDGHYDYKKMIADFLRLSAEAELYLQDEIQRISNERAQVIATMTKQAEDAHNAAYRRHEALIRSKKDEESDETRAVLQHREAFFHSELIAGFESRVAMAISDCGILPKDWGTYDPKRKPVNRLAVGSIKIPFRTDSQSLQSALLKAIPNYARNGFFVLPYMIGRTKPFKMYFQYDDETKSLAKQQIQLVLLRLLRGASADSFDIYIVDPKERGNALGVLNAPIAENEKIGIRVSNSKDEIKELFKGLEREIDEINRQVGAKTSLHEYNLTASSPLKDKVIVLFDFPENFDAEEVKAFGTIAENAHRCGVNIILASTLSTAALKGSFKNAAIDWGFMDTGWTAIDAKRETIAVGDSQYEFAFEEIADVHGRFVTMYRSLYEQGTKLDNNFSHLFDVSKTSYKDATDGLYLPVMMRAEKNGAVCDLVIGTSTSTHTLITGNTSSGKSTFLHMIISSVLMNYHPDDVELWLVDYGKVEFNRYYQTTPPHVRFISLEKSAEFTYSFLAYLKEYFSAREKLFTAVQVSDIKEYRKKFGQHSMPRILLIVDEFHNMTQHVQQNIAYREILENALAEYRKFGLSCIFSNQTISGLQGLTDTAKLQIKNRIALSNEIGEMKLTLAVTSGNYSEEMLHRMERTAVGELWYKEWVSVSDFAIHQFKGVYIDEVSRQEVLRLAIERNKDIKNDAESIKINSSERQIIPVGDLISLVKGKTTDRQFPLYLGSPVTIDKTFSINVERRYNHNILLVGKDLKLKRDIITTIILNASMIGGFDIYVYADEGDELYNLLSGANRLRSKTCDVKIYNDIGQICHSVYEKTKCCEKKEVQRRSLIFWFGISDMFDEFNVCPPKTIVESDLQKNVVQDDMIHLDDISELENDYELIEMAKSVGCTVKEILYNLSAKEPVESHRHQVDYSYNAREDVARLFSTGGKYNIFNVMALDSTSEFKRIREIGVSLFLHKILLNIPKDELYELGLRNPNIELEEGVAALYSDGMQYKKFRPYLVKKEG